MDTNIQTKLNENDIQKRLELETGGGHKSCLFGIPDIVTDTQLIEIKSWKYYKHAVGQLLHYNECFPDRQLILHFFGEKIKKQEKLDSFLALAKKYNITITEEPENQVYPLKESSDKFNRIDWPNIIKGKKTLLKNTFNEIYKKLTRHLTRKLECDEFKEFYRNKAALEILDNELTIRKKLNESVMNNKDVDDVRNNMKMLYFENAVEVKTRYYDIKKRIKPILCAKIKPECIPTLELFVYKNMQKNNLEDITIQTITDSIIKALIVLLENFDRYFINGDKYHAYDILYIKRKPMKTLNINFKYVNITSLFNLLQKYYEKKLKLEIENSLPTLIDVNTENVESIFTTKNPRNASMRIRKDDYLEPIETRKEDFIPKIKRSYQDDAHYKFNDELENLIEQYKEDNGLPDNYEISQELLNKYKKKALEIIYQYYEKYKRAAFKKNVIFREKKSKTDEENKVKEFINLFYIDTPKDLPKDLHKDLPKGSHTCDLHKHYEKWMIEKYPEHISTNKITFGKIIAKEEIMGRKIERYIDKGKQGWQLISKDCI